MIGINKTLLDIEYSSNVLERHLKYDLKARRVDIIIFTKIKI